MIRDRAADAVVNGWNQYPPMLGLPELRQAVAAHYDHHHGLALDPAREVMITSGATEAIVGALLALIEPGDEVVLFEPMYDAYLPLVLRAGGVPWFVTLSPPDWQLTAEALAAFTPKTRVVLFNNPLNPAAKVFPTEDLELLARACVEHDVVAICDEVWEHVIFDGRRSRMARAIRMHISPACGRGLRRAVTNSPRAWWISGSKYCRARAPTFSMSISRRSAPMTMSPSAPGSSRTMEWPRSR